MTTNLDASPCRLCAKQANITCRNRCKRLKDYQKLAGETILVRNYEDQYDADSYGIEKTLSNKIPGMDRGQMSEQPLAPLAGKSANAPYHPPSSRRWGEKWGKPK